MQYPLAVATNAEGTAFVVDLDLPGLWKVTEGRIEPFVQASKSFRTPLNRPRCIAIDLEGNLLIGDTPMRNIYRLPSTAPTSTEDLKGVPALAQRADQTGIGMPLGLAVNKAGDIFVADAEVHWIWKIAAAGGEPTKFAEVKAPRGMCIDGEDRLYVVSGGPDPLVRVAADGKVETIFKGKIAGGNPCSVAVDKSGNAYVSDNYTKTIWKVGADGKPVAFAQGDPFVRPNGLAWLGDDLLVADPHAKSLFLVDPQGKIRKWAPAP
jgi:sugar lactone lactonase YvrE